MSIKSKIVKYFAIKCPKCDGHLYITGLHITTFWGSVDVYECDKCKNRFI